MLRLSFFFWSMEERVIEAAWSARSTRWGRGYYLNVHVTQRERENQDTEYSQRAERKKCSQP